METKLSYTLVGLFVIVLGAALIGSVLWLTVGTAEKEFDIYRVYTAESVAGLNPKASVRYRGVEVGQVATVELDPDNPERVEIILEIEHGTPIRQDTRAVLVTQGLTGLTTVELTGGSRDAPPLEPGPGERWPVIKSRPSLVTRLDNAFTTLLTQFNDLSGRVELLLSEHNQAMLSGILSNIEEITAVVSGRSSNIERMLDNLEVVTAAVAAHSNTIGKALDSAATTLESSARISTELTPLLGRVSAGAVAVGEMSKVISQTSKDLVAAVNESRQNIRKLAQSTAPELDALLSELRNLADTMRRFVEDLDRNPQMLLLGKPSGRPGPGE